MSKHTYPPQENRGLCSRWSVPDLRFPRLTSKSERVQFPFPLIMVGPDASPCTPALAFVSLRLSTIWLKDCSVRNGGQFRVCLGVTPKPVSSSPDPLTSSIRFRYGNPVLL